MDWYPSRHRFLLTNATIHCGCGARNVRTMALRAALRLRRDQSRQERRPHVRLRRRAGRLVRTVLRQEVDQVFMDLHAGRRRRAWNLESDPDIFQLASGADAAARDLPCHRRGARRRCDGERGWREYRGQHFRRHPAHLESSARHDRLANAFVFSYRRSVGRYDRVALPARRFGLSGYGPRVISQYQSGSGHEYASAGRGQIRSQRNPQPLQGPAA